MTTALTKAVARVTTRPYIGRHKDARGRTIVVTLLPGDMIALRPSRTRRVEYMNLSHIYEIALESRIRSERMQRLNFKKRNKGLRK